MVITTFFWFADFNENLLDGNTIIPSSVRNVNYNLAVYLLVCVCLPAFIYVYLSAFILICLHTCITLVSDFFLLWNFLNAECFSYQYSTMTNYKYYIFNPLTSYITQIQELFQYAQSLLWSWFATYLNVVLAALVRVVIPVSYTHLDVYKRQGVIGVKLRIFQRGILQFKGCWDPYN